jgi:hypothetical protein
MKLATWDVIFTSMDIPKISVIRLLIPSVEVVRIKRKCLFALCTSHMWREQLKRIGNCYMRTIFKTKHVLGGPLTRIGPERDPQQMAHCVYITFPVNVAEATLAKETCSQAAPLTWAHSQRGSSRKIKISPTCLWRSLSSGILEIESNSRKEYIRNRPIQHA